MNEHIPREILSALVDGECGPEQRRSVHEHLKACDECRRAAGELSTVQAMVSGLPPLVAPGSFVAASVGERRGLRKVTSRVGRRMRLAAIAVAAAAVAISLAGVAAPPAGEEMPVDVFLTRHVGVSNGDVLGGQVLFGLTVRNDEP